VLVDDTNPARGDQNTLNFTPDNWNRRRQ